MDYEVRIEQFPTLSTAVVKRRAAIAELPRVVPEGCGVVWREIRAQGIAGAGRNLAVYCDEAINLEVGVEMTAPFAGSGDVVASTIPAGRVAMATHMGPYQLLAGAHNAIRDWCAQQGLAFAGPNWEIYAHWQEAWNSDPSQIRTDVYYLLGDGG